VTLRVERHGPIVLPDTHPPAGTNINGPSLIRVPTWVPDPLGRYYLYFADHKGSSIRLAVADVVTGPYRIYEPGSLHLRDSGFPTEMPPAIEAQSSVQAAAVEAEGYEAHFTPHIASPDVVVDHDRERIVMAFHGLCADGSQRTRIAESPDGLAFSAHPTLVDFPYLRILPEPVGGTWLGLAMPGVLYRSRDLLSWKPGRMVFDLDFRHCALARRDQTLHVFWSRVGDAPEHILHSTIDMNGPRTMWTPAAPESLLRPEQPWEGADLAVVPSVRGQATERVRQLRDPAIFEEAGRVWLLYTVAGESGIAIAEVHGL
jgi:hypothetical protein